MATERLQVILEMAAGQYKREAREAATATGSISKQAQAAATQTGALQTRMVGFGSVLRGAAVTGGVLALGRGLASAVDNAERINSIAAVTEQVIQQTGRAANVTAGQLLEMSDRLEVLTGVESELVQEGGNVLLTFRNIANQAGEGNDIFDRTLGLMLDIGAVMGTDTTSAALQLGKALNDPVSQMGALSRAGLTFSKVQKDQIKDLVANNDLLSAQKIILDELETQLGGTAEAAVDASDKIVNSFGRITDAVGLALLPFIDRLAIELEVLTTDLDRMEAVTGQTADSLGYLGGQINSFAQGLSEDGAQANAFREKVAELLDTTDADAATFQKLRNGLDALVRDFDLTEEGAVIVAQLLDDRLGPAMAETADKVLLLKKNFDRSDTAMLNMARRGGVLAAETLAEISEEAGSAVPSVQDLAAAVRDVNTAMLEAANPIFAAQQALSRYQEVLVEVDEDGARTADEQFRLAEAALEANAALGELGAGNTTAGIQAIADSLGISFGAAQDLAEQLGILDGTEVNLLFTASMPAADRALINSVNTATSGASTGPRVSVPSNIRHSGGPGVGGQSYLIRPNEEIFVPSGSGEFLLNDQVIKALKGLAGGGSTHNYNIPIQSSGNPQADAQLAGSIASVLRRMETL